MNKWTPYAAMSKACFGLLAPLRYTVAVKCYGHKTSGRMSNLKAGTRKLESVCPRVGVWLLVSGSERKLEPIYK